MSRLIRTFSLSDTLVLRLLGAAARAESDKAFADKLNLRVAPLRQPDAQGLVASDYAEIQEAVQRKDLSGAELLSYAILPGLAPREIRSRARKIIRLAQIRNRRSRSAAPISASRLVEALLLKGLETVDAAVDTHASANSNDGKASRQRANSKARKQA